MYCWIHNCLKETIINLCGEETWNLICAKAGVATDEVSKLESTTYEEYFAIVAAALEVLPHISEQDLYDMYGDNFISYIQKKGYEKYLLTFGDTLYELLNNMNKLHAHVACTMDKLKMPIIHCKECDEKDTFFLHYSSPRGDRLACMLVGVIKSVARTYFCREVTLTELARQGDAAGAASTIWKVRLARVVVIYLDSICAITRFVSVLFEHIFDVICTFCVVERDEREKRQIVINSIHVVAIFK